MPKVNNTEPARVLLRKLKLEGYRIRITACASAVDQLRTVLDRVKQEKLKSFNTTHVTELHVTFKRIKK